MDSGSEILRVVSDYIAAIGLKNVDLVYNSKTNTVCITGLKNGYRFTTTIRRCDNVIPTNDAREVLKVQIKDLLKDGYKQSDIVRLLGVSQSLVSKYSRDKV